MRFQVTGSREFKCPLVSDLFFTFVKLPDRDTLFLEGFKVALIRKKRVGSLTPKLLDGAA